MMPLWAVHIGDGQLTFAWCAGGLALPALAAWGLFAGLHRLPWVRRPLFRAGLVGLSTVLFALSMVYAVTALVTNYGSAALTPDLSAANRHTFQPLTLAAASL